MTPVNKNRDQGTNTAPYDDKAHHEHRSRNYIHMVSDNKQNEKFSPGQSPDYNPEDFNTD